MAKTNVHRARDLAQRMSTMGETRVMTAAELVAPIRQLSEHHGSRHYGRRESYRVGSATAFSPWEIPELRDLSRLDVDPLRERWPLTAAAVTSRPGKWPSDYHEGAMVHVHTTHVVARRRNGREFALCKLDLELPQTSVRYIRVRSIKCRPCIAVLKRIAADLVREAFGAAEEMDHEPAIAAIAADWLDERASCPYRHLVRVRAARLWHEIVRERQRVADFQRPLFPE